MTLVEFRVLGPVECLVDGQPLPLGGAKRRAVLAALLLAEGRPLPLGQLVDAVWDAVAPPTAGKQVRNAVSDLRRRLPAGGPAIRPAGDGYQIDLTRAELDLGTFGRRTVRARKLRDGARAAEAVAEFRAALGLWRGPALAGLDSPTLRAQAAGLEERGLAVLEECIELELDRGGHEELVGELSGLVARNPLRERLVAQLMVALCRSGAPAQALSAYERSRRALADELGVAPGPTLRDLHRRVLVGTVPAGARYGPADGCDNLPGDLGHFTGRGPELARLADAVDRRDHAGPRVVAIDGMPGVGKTALAVHLAHQLWGTRAADRVYVDLGAHRGAPRGPLDALGILLCTLGLPAAAIPAGLAERSAVWRRELAGRCAVIVLDDVADAEHVGPLLPGAETCVTVVTSRRRLTGLNYTEQLSLRELSLVEGRQLFQRLVGDGRPAAEPAATEAVLDRCGGLPRAIHAAASRLRHRPAWRVGHLADRLADDDHLLSELDGADGGLLDGFARSYDRLSRNDQCLFRLVGAMPEGDVGLSAVARLAGLPPYRVERRLEGLVDAHLLEETAPGWYRIHGLLRRYAAGLRPVPRRPGAGAPRSLGGVPGMPQRCSHGGEPGRGGVRAGASRPGSGRRPGRRGKPGR